MSHTILRPFVVKLSVLSIELERNGFYLYGIKTYRVSVFGIYIISRYMLMT